MTPIPLIVGAGQLDRVLPDAVDLLRHYRTVTGCYYLDYAPITPQHTLVPEDLAVTLLLNSQVGWRAFRSVQLLGATIALDALPATALEQTTPDERRHVAQMIATVAQWDGFAASVATKILHKKRPDLIPILDNQAIFDAYMNPDWPYQHAVSTSIKAEAIIRAALDWIAVDITRPENTLVWDTLQRYEPARTRIQLFDSIWWTYFRTVQPVPTRRRKTV